jgi:hypothetical protein
MVKFMKPHVEQADGVSASIDPKSPDEGQVTVTIGGEWRIFRLSREALQRLHRQLGRELAAQLPPSIPRKRPSATSQNK